MALLADPAATPDLFALREQARRWRFYDHLRTDADAAGPAAGRRDVHAGAGRPPATTWPPRC